MNKKILTIISVIVVSVLLLLGGKVLQNKYASNNDNNQTASSAVMAVSSDSSAKKQDSSNTNESKKTNTASVNAPSATQNNKTTVDKRTVTNNSGTASGGTAPKEPSPVAGPVDKTEEPNFIIYNDISKKILYSAKVNFNKGDTAANITKNFLDSNKIDYTIPPVGGFYISNIAGLREKQHGSLSGWCFYVNGVKSSVGASSYTLKLGDKITWKYLADALNN